MMGSPRARWIDDIARALGRVSPRPLPAPQPPGETAADDRTFQRLAESVGTRVHRAHSLEDVRRILVDLRTTYPGPWAWSRAPLLGVALAGVADFIAPSDRPGLLGAAAGLSCAQWGIAESGTLVLDGRVEDHRLVSLLPPVHVAVLLRSRLVSTLGETLEHLARQGPLIGSAVTFVTGPSRTADIELTLVVGVHGPRELHVVLVEDGELV